MFVLFWSAKKITRTPSPKVQGRSNKKTRPKLKTKTQRQNETKQKPLQGEIAALSMTLFPNTKVSFSERKRHKCRFVSENYIVTAVIKTSQK